MVGTLSDCTLLLGGEVVAFDARGVSCFQLLQRSSSAHTFAVFDCLYLNGKDPDGDRLFKIDGPSREQQLAN